MRRLPKYDEPQHDDEIALCDADGKENGLYSRVQQVLSQDFKKDRYEVKDQQGRVLYIERASEDSWRQFLLKQG